MKEYFYLGSLRRQRNHGVLLDSFIIKATKVKDNKRKDFVLATLELGELIRILKLENTLTGLWKMYQSDYEEQSASTADVIKKQLADMIYSKLGVAPAAVSSTAGEPLPLHKTVQDVSPIQPTPTSINQQPIGQGAIPHPPSPPVVPTPEAVMSNQRGSSSTARHTTTEINTESPQKKTGLSGLMTLS